MSERLDEIRDTLELTEQAVTDFEKEWPDLACDTPAKLYVQDIGYLLGFLTEHPASEPPGGERMVIVKLSSGRRSMGCFRQGQWFAFGHRQGLAPYDTVESWQELPPLREKENG